MPEIVSVSPSATNALPETGASGFRIVDGAIAGPVADFTIAGNLKDMFLNLTPASDLEFRYGINVPTLRIDGMTIASG